MRFLLFNALVVVALFHLFSGNDGDLGKRADAVLDKARGVVDSAVERLGDPSRKADTSGELQTSENRSPDANTEPAAVQPETTRTAKTRDTGKTARSDRERSTAKQDRASADDADTTGPANLTASRDTASRQSAANAGASKTGTSSGDAGQPTPLQNTSSRDSKAGSVGAAQDTVDRPRTVETPEKSERSGSSQREPGATAEPGRNRATGQATDRPEPTDAARRDDRVALAEGDKLMSDRERRQELFKLAREMEMMFVENLGD